ncbi:phosphatase PAP2 family protein [Streptomyces sp. KK5PA1]|uniref:Phosphatase PAP2 family protein n=1 Tax=Actinacidiphila acididurans TaxID=2784346 RepID=A0ABS2TIJ6_9ACTN|nr:phosphatase PAP2 family protein [Actinacidiphila acididurans]
MTNDTSAASSGARRGGLLPARLRPLSRPRVWVELAFSAALYVAYDCTRSLVPDHRIAAMHRASWIWHAERVLHLDPELAVNHAVNHVRWLIVGMNYYYATLHFVVTLGVLVWLYARHAASYRSARTALYTATLLALIGFTFFALAPPRFLTGDGFVDTVVVHHTWGSWGSGHVSSVSNQYAAMPSVHIVWSTWSGLTLAALAHRTWVRVLGVCYPLATFTVILATANHFVADAVGGALTLAVGFLIQRLLTGRMAYQRVSGDRDRRHGVGEPPTGPDARPAPPADRPATPLTTAGPAERRPAPAITRRPDLQDPPGRRCPARWRGMGASEEQRAAPTRPRWGRQHPDPDGPPSPESRTRSPGPGDGPGDPPRRTSPADLVPGRRVRDRLRLALQMITAALTRK